jgi:hypothetical protein
MAGVEKVRLQYEAAKAQGLRRIKKMHAAQRLAPIFPQNL